MRLALGLSLLCLAAGAGCSVAKMNFPQPLHSDGKAWSWACEDCQPCVEVSLSDLLPAYEYNVHGCLTLNSVYWQPDMRIDGVLIEKGLGMHPPAAVETPDERCTYFRDIGVEPGHGRAGWNLRGRFQRLRGWVGLAEPDTAGVVVFRVFADGQLLWESGEFNARTRPKELELDLWGVDMLELDVDSLGDHYSDSAVWIDPRLLTACGSGYVQLVVGSK